MEIHRFNHDVLAYNEAADRVMAAAGVPSIDLHRFSLNLGQPQAILHDGRHFHPSIQEQQAGFIAGWLIGWWSRVATG